MRTLLLTVLLIAINLARPEFAAADEPQAVLEKAILAAGGEEQIAKFKAVRSKAKGTVNLGTEVPFTWEITWQWPNQYKMAAELQAGGQKVALVQAFDGSSGWGEVSGVTAPIAGQKLKELEAQMHLRRILMLTPLLNDKAFELAPVDDLLIDTKPAAGVRVSSSGHRDVNLFFDRSTGLLTKIERFVFDNATTKEVLQEDFLSNYQVVDGVKSAMKEVWFRSGAKVAEIEYTEVSYPRKFDAREFARPAEGPSADVPPMTRTANVIYGRKLGMALTMDVFTPIGSANGAAIILVVSGGWVSDSEALNRQLIGNFIAEPVKRGYTVFAVFHGSQPKFTIPEVVADINRAVRYIRHHASYYQIDPDRIGITGGSAGGHLSLMQGTSGDLGNSTSNDAVERASSRVQAVACLFPPTDFLNYGDDGKYAFALDGTLAAFRAAIDVREMDPKTFRLERVEEQQQEKHLALAAKISPISHVSADDPPTLIIHGDADRLVPIQQAELIVAKLKGAGVRAELITRKGRGHDFAGIDKDVATMTDWFDEHLKKK
jgi:acetyl esterase/lipase